MSYESEPKVNKQQPTAGSESSVELSAMRTITVLIEVPSDQAGAEFRELLETCCEEMVSADPSTLTIHLRKPK